MHISPSDTTLPQWAKRDPIRSPHTPLLAAAVSLQLLCSGIDCTKLSKKWRAPHHAGFLPVLCTHDVPPALEGIREQPRLHALAHILQDTPEGCSVMCKLPPGCESSHCHTSLPVLLC